MREESLVTSIMKRNVAGGISTVCYVIFPFHETQQEILSEI